MMRRERYIGRKADKNRKIYNGMLRTYFYQFMGPKPPRRSVRDTAGGMNEIFKRYIVFGVLVAAMLIFKLEPGHRGAERWKISAEPICRRQPGTR